MSYVTSDSASESQFHLNIWQEHLCHLVNDDFIELIELAAEAVAPAALEREQGPWFISAGYTGSRATHLWQEYEANVSRWDGS